MQGIRCLAVIIIEGKKETNKNGYEMKKITTILFLLLNFITIDSQTVEMLSGDPEWYYWMTYDLHDGMVSHDYFLAYGVHGTMELNGRCYHTMYWLNHAYIDWGGEVYAPEFPVYVREANGIVYADYESYANAAKEQGYNEPCPYKKTDDGEIILYDFTLKAGDKYPTAPEVDPIFVNDIKEHLKEGQVVKVKILSIGDDGKIGLSIKKALPPQNNAGNRQHKSPDRAPRQHTSPSSYEWQPARQSESASFEDMLSKFKQTSDEKISNLKRTNDSRRGASRRGNSSKQ